MSRRFETLARDVTAAIAFGAVAISGSVPAVVLVIFPVALLASLRGVRPLAGRRVTSVLVLLGVAAGLFGWSLFGALDLVVAAVSFAVLVVCHRLLAEPTAQTTRQVLLTSLLVITGGAAIVGDVLFAVFVVGFIVSASWTMARLVLDGPEGHRAPGVDETPARRQVFAGTALIIALGITFFVVFPRLSWSQSIKRASPGLGGVTGMAETVRLGGGGGIKTNPRVVFRVALDPDPGTERLASYWVGRRFTRFDGREWLSTGAPEPPSSRVILTFAERQALKSTVTQEFVLTSAYGSQTLVALDTPTAFLKVRGTSVSGSMPVSIIRVPGDQVLASLPANELQYTAVSVTRSRVDLTPPDPAASEVPILDPRVKALATELRGDARTPVEIATRLEQGLTRRYGYTLELPGEVDDPLSSFLFDRRAGHCEDFATALAVLLRLEGIPSRVVTGFVGGERFGSRYHVRAGDAHAWTEAYLDGAWQRFDATPEDGRQASPPRWLAALTERYEAVEAWWRERVIDYSFQDQFTAVRNLVRPPPGLPSPDRDRSETTTLVEWTTPVLGLLVLVLIVVAVRRWGRGRRGHVATGLLKAIENRLQARGIDPTTEPIEELSARLTSTRHPLAPALAQVTRRYLEARFGQRALEAGEARELLAQLESAPSEPRG